MINIIVAIDKNNAIGKDNKLLVHLIDDLKYFQETTKGHIVVMGRKTYEGLPVKPLKDRENIILTRDNITYEGAKVVHSIKEVLKLSNDKDVFICGGQSVYEQFMPHAHKLYITYIFSEFNADTYFPVIDDGWEIESVDATRVGIQNEHPYVFVVYRRK